MRLKELPIRISYTSKGTNNILDNFLIPALKCSKIYKRSVGFFSSSVFELIESGLEHFINNDGKIYIICSPKLSEKDIEAIKLGKALRQAVMQQKLLQDLEDALRKIEDKNLKLLVNLIKNGQLEIKLVDVDDELGIYHDKIGLVEDSEGDKVLFVGSANESKNAYSANYEKIRVSVSWNEWDSLRIKDDEEEFDSIWNGTHEYINGVDCTEVIGTKITNTLKERISQKQAIEMEETDSVKKGIKLRDYQKEAINAWLDNGKKGFFVMATGTGKTWTAIYAALEVAKEENIFLVICAPYKHLVKQWYEDVHKVFPECQTVMISSENSHWDYQLKDAIFDSKYCTGKTVIAISTILSFNSERFMNVAKSVKMKKMLIVDEAHRFKNLDSKIQKLYNYMLGLSATPSSKKNDENALKLMNFFGGQVYNLPIEFAIENGYLVHYNYYPIYVQATAEEETNFERYTKLLVSCFRNNVCIDVEGAARYKRGRLRVISMAQEKIDKIEWILSHIKEENHFIVYCGDGKLVDVNSSDGKRHIQYVKEVLSNKGYKTNQFTAEENMNKRMQLVKSFNIGMIDSLVAIRCLDEGINIPSINGALILSSNDDYREFIQRRGRILRTYFNPFTGEEKECANIYDVIVLPSTYMTNFASIELRRFYEYAKLADNAKDCLRECEDLCIQYGINLDDIMQTEEIEDELDE